MRKPRSELTILKDRERSRIKYRENRKDCIKASTDYRNTASLTEQYRIKRMLSSAKRRSTDKNVPFNLTYEGLIDIWKRQNGRCCISGRIFDLDPSEERVNKDAPSLDRIVPQLGYVFGNVRFITWQTNAAISEYGLENFIALCKDIMEFNKENYDNQTP